MRRTAFRPDGKMRLGRLMALLTILVLPIIGGAGVIAAPVSQPSFERARHETPGWMGADTASRLALDFEVLVPAYVPAPFEGEPDVTAHDGYYSLYWVVPGAPPTFLQISGEVGGTIPDYSKFDRNNQLEQNADVGGVPAYHDLTPIYDLVYWQIENVVYSVESRNLTEDDSLGLATSLVSLSTQDPGNTGTDTAATLSVPDSVVAGEVVSVGVDGVEGATLTADDGYFTETGEGTYQGAGGNAVDWQAPSSDQETTVTFALTDPNTGDTIASASTLVAPASAQAAPLTIDCPSSVSAGETMEFTLSGSGQAIIDAVDGSFPGGSPNSDFASVSDDGRTMVGQVPESGSTTLVWTAPESSDSGTVYLFATTESGETTGECAVEIIPVAASQGDASGDSAVTAAEADGANGGNSEQNQDSNNVQTEQPTAAPTKEADKKQPTGVANEVSGLPTPGPGDGGDSSGPASAAPSPTPTPNLTPTVRPTATIAPTTSENGGAASIIGPGGGSLASTRGASVSIPEGALTDASTLSIQPVPDTKLPAQDGVDPISNSAFDVTLAGPDGRAIAKLLKPADLRIELDKDRMKDGARIYRVEGTQLIALPNSRIEGNALVVSVDQFSRFVVGVPSTVQGSQNRSLVPFILAAIVVILVMLAMIVLGGMFRPRRQRVVVTRRPTRTRYR